MPSRNSGSAPSSTVFSTTSKQCISPIWTAYSRHRHGGKIDRTLSDFIAYPGIRQWWETRKHWHTEEFGHVVEAIIARGDEPKAYSAYNLREIVAPETSS